MQYIISFDAEWQAKFKTFFIYSTMRHSCLFNMLRIIRSKTEPHYFFIEYALSLIKYGLITLIST